MITLVNFLAFHVMILNNKGYYSKGAELQTLLRLIVKFELKKFCEC